MALVNDVNGMARQVHTSRYVLLGAYWFDKIHAGDYAPIHEFCNHREMNEEVALSTLRDDINQLRRISQRAEKPLLEFASTKDTNAFLRTNKTKHGVTDRSNDNYRKVLRNFFHWLDDDPDYGAYEWWEDVKIPSREVEPVDPEEVLSIEEVRRMVDAATHPREKALIEFLADTGMRIAAALQVKRGAIKGLDTRHPTVAVNREGESQKGMDVLPRPIIQSGRPLRVYLHQNHPDDHPEAAVFAAKHYKTRTRENGAISPTTTLNTLKDLGESVGIDRDRVTNHCFRHVATTRMRRDMNMDWDDIAHRTGWSERTIARMKKLYGHLTNEDKNDRIWKAAGRQTDADADDDGPLFEPCINCGQELPAGTRYCPDCGADQNATSAENRLRRTLASLDEETANRLADTIEMIESEPEMRAAYEGGE